MLVKLASVRKDGALETAVVQGKDDGRQYINIDSRILAG